MRNQTHLHNVLDTNHIGSLLMKLTAPAFLGMIVQNIYQVFDAIFIGRYVGSEGLAALAIVMPIQMIVLGAANIVSVGGASLISRLIGQREPLKAERALGISICFSLILSVIVTIIIVPFPGFWLGLMGTSQAVLPVATEYLTIAISGTIFNLCLTVLLSLVKAEGNARVSMISMMVQSILNISLDALFIIVLKMGIRGAALALIISQGVSLIYVMSYYFTGKSYLKISFRNFLPEKKIIRGIFEIGVSQFFKAICDSLSVFVIFKMVSQYGGDTGLSVFSILMRILNFAYTPANVLGQAMQPILGFNYGAKRFRQVLKSIMYPLIISASLGLCALLIFIFAIGPIVGIFTSDASLIQTAISDARIMYLGMVSFCIFAVSQLVFPSIGAPISTFLISVLRPLCLITPVALIMPRLFGVRGVWMIFPVGDTVSCLFVLGFLIPLIRKFRRLAADQPSEISIKSVAEKDLDTT